MANLDNLIRWHHYAPDLGGNRLLERPFFVKLAVGLTKPDLAKLAEALKDFGGKAERADDAPVPTPEEMTASLEAKADTLAAALGPFVQMGDEPLRVGGEHIDSLQKLLRLYTRLHAGGVAMLEIPTALRYFNEAVGTVQLFYGRLSGGSVSTDPTGRAAR